LNYSYEKGKLLGAADRNCDTDTPVGRLWRVQDSSARETAISALANPPAVEALSFENALKELEDIVARLEQGAVDLEDSIALYERGQALKSHCEAKLKAAEGRLEKIVMGANGPQIGGMVESA
jgi:exodeoxyribonuclease VII small subunit